MAQWPYIGHWLYVVCEWQTRELPSRLLVSAFAAARNYGVVIGDARVFKENYFKLPTGLFLLKGMHGPLCMSLKANGFYISILDEETFGYYSGYCDLRLKQRTDTLSMRAADKVLVWGQAQKDIFTKQFPSFEDRIVVTGTPRLDLCRPELRQVYAKKAEEIRHQYGKFILFNSNFANATRFESAEAQSKAAKFRVESSAEEVRHWETKRYEFKAHSLKECTDALKDIRKAFPDMNIVVRPHQEDDPEYWKKEIGPIDRCFVIRDDHVYPWILAAQAMVHHTSSTGVESWMFGTPVISYQPPHPEEERFREINSRVGSIARTSEELVDELRRLAGKRDAQLADHGWMADYFANVEGRLASERVVDALDDIIYPPDMWYYSQVPNWARYDGARRLGRQGKYLVDRLTGTSHEKAIRSRWTPHRKWPPTSLEMLGRLLDEYKTSFPALRDVELVEIDQELYGLFTSSMLDTSRRNRRPLKRVRR